MYVRKRMGDKKISPPPLHWEPEEMYVCNIFSEVCGDGERERERDTHTCWRMKGISVVVGMYIQPVFCSTFLLTLLENLEASSSPQPSPLSTIIKCSDRFARQPVY